jgi:hypothetical protein
MEKNTMRYVHALTTAAVITAASSSLSAEIEIDYSGMAAYEQIRYSFDSSVAWNSVNRPSNKNAFSGQLKFNGGNLYGFCIELLQDVSSEVQVYECQTFEEQLSPLSERGGLVARLFEEYYPEVLDGGSQALASAFQMMVWELSHENFNSSAEAINQISLTQGATQFSEYSVEAEMYFNAMTSVLNYNASTGGVRILANGEFQDFVTVTIPGPSVLALCGIGLTLGKRKRRS